MKHSRIIGSGSYLPRQVVTNDDLAKRIDTSHEWIVERTGIERRHIVSGDETATSMACMAADRALEMARLKREDLDFILVATTTPDLVFPNTACLMQEQWGLDTQCAALDVNAACAGFIYALNIADQFIKTGTYKNILVVGTEIMSRIIDFEDRRTCVLFGDGAGAMVLTVSDEPGIYSTHLHADGRKRQLLFARGTREAGQDYHFVEMDGREVFKMAVKALGNSVIETLEASGFQQTDLDWLVPHQANLRIIKAIADKLSLPMEQVILGIEEQGNTSSASIPLAFDTAVREGKIKAGDLCLLEAFGGGMAWGSALLRM